MRFKVICCMIALIFCALCLSALASEAFEIDGVIYQEIDGFAVTVGYNQQVETIVYHHTVRGLPVRMTELLNDLEWIQQPGCARMLVVEEGVTHIPEASFRFWPVLETILLPTTLRSIGDYSFLGHSELKEVILPEHMTAIGAEVLSHCPKLEHIHIPAALASIGSGALSTMGSTRITLSEGNTAFRMADGALYDADMSTLILVQGAYEGELRLPESVRKISVGAMGSALRMTSLILPEGITELTYGHIGRCYKLERLRLPASLTYIEHYLLENLISLDWVEADAAHPMYYSIDGMLFTRDEHKLVFAPYLRESIDVPQGTLALAPGVFAGRRNLASVSLPSGIRQIPDSAFIEATALRRVALPITLETIGHGAFADCIALADITLPPGLSGIGWHAFFNCTSLKALTLPDTVTDIHYSALPRWNPDFVLFCREGSAGYKAAWVTETLWAEPGGRPINLYQHGRRSLPVAVVSNASRDTKLNLRVSPSKNSKSLGLYENGTPVRVIETDNGWAHVRLGDLEGYMLLEALTFTDALTGTERILWCRSVIADKPLNAYSTPYTGALAVQVEGGRVLIVTDQLGTWLEVDLNGALGYVRTCDVHVAWIGESALGERRDLHIVANPDPCDRLHLRAEPNRNSVSLGRFFNGTVVRTIAWHNDEWLKVSVDGKEGFMLREFLDPVGIGEGSLDTSGFG
jgi:uncharacterized protein YgiM (DUF1202 family)